MSRCLTRSSFALLAAAALAVFPTRGAAQVVVVPAAPVVVPAPPVISASYLAYTPPAVTYSYYRAPAVSYSYYAAPAAAYSVPRVSYYAAPAVTTYSPAVVAPGGGVVTTYTYHNGLGIFRPRYVNQTYYTPLP